MTRIDKSKVETHRDTLQALAKAPAATKKHLEGKAAKLGVEIQGEQSKAAPTSHPRKK